MTASRTTADIIHTAAILDLSINTFDGDVYANGLFRSKYESGRLSLVNAGASGNFFQGFSNETAKVPMYIDSFYFTGGTASGTNAIVFRLGASGTPSEAMRITSSGELLINTTTDSGDYKLQVNGGINAFGEIKSSVDGGFYSRMISTSASGGSFFQAFCLESDKKPLYIDNVYSAVGSPSGESFIGWRTGSSAAATEKMRLTESGDFLIGTSTDNGDYQLQVGGNANVLVVGSTPIIDLKVAANTEFPRYRFLNATGTVVSELIYSVTDEYLRFDTGGTTERMRITSGNGLLVGTTSVSLAGNTSGEGVRIGNNHIQIATDNSPGLFVNRMSGDGGLIYFYQAGTLEGSIDVSGTTVSLTGAHLTRWSQLIGDGPKTTIARGTVMSTIDEMCAWPGEDNEQLTRAKISDVVSDKTVSGVFQDWDNDDENKDNDMLIAQSGDFVIRVTGPVNKGDLLESNGDGTAKVQADDLVRSSTIAKAMFSFPSALVNDENIVPCLIMLC